MGTFRPADVGPLQALIDELEFNTKVASNNDGRTRGALFSEQQFHRGMAHGAISTLETSLKALILDAYAVMSRANEHILGEIRESDASRNTHNRAAGVAARSIADAGPKIKDALSYLLRFLTPEGATESLNASGTTRQDSLT